MTWKSSYLPAVLALGFVLTGPAGKAQQTHGATTPKKRVPHPPSGTAVKPPANAVTNQGVPPGTGRRQSAIQPLCHHQASQSDVSTIGSNRRRQEQERDCEWRGEWRIGWVQRCCRSVSE
jgi:hypothetical protein